MKLDSMQFPIRGTDELAIGVKSLRDYVYNEAQNAAKEMSRFYTQPLTVEDRIEAFERYSSSLLHATWWRNAVLTKKRDLERRFSMNLDGILGDLETAAKEGFSVGFGKIITEQMQDVGQSTQSTLPSAQTLALTANGTEKAAQTVKAAQQFKPEQKPVEDCL